MRKLNMMQYYVSGRKSLSLKIPKKKQTKIETGIALAPLERFLRFSSSPSSPLSLSLSPHFHRRCSQCLCLSLCRPLGR
jgi:hypothetical protein